METKKRTVVGLGELLYDHDLATGKYTFGGAPANFADHFLQCAALLSGRLQAEVWVVSAVGARGTRPDPWGRKAILRLKKRGLHALLTPVEGAPTGMVDKTSDAAGNNTYHVLPAAWDAIAWSEELEELARRCDVVCFGSLAQRDGRSRRTILRFLRTMKAQRRDTLRVFDVNIRLPQQLTAEGRKKALEELRPILEDSIRLCNVLKISDEEASVVSEILTGRPLAGSARDFCRELLAANRSLGTVILTEGSRGSCILTPHRESVYVIPSDARRRVVNTVGAGYSFTAAFCAQLVAGADLWQAQSFASRIAAFVCRRASATPRYPERIAPEFLA